MNSTIDRIKVWKETQEYVDKKLTDYKIVPSIKYNLKMVEHNIKQKKHNKNNIMVVSEDCVNATRQLIENDFNPLLLNMSDDIYAGGCVDRGSGAQEENCFRRSSYYKTLLQSFYPLTDTDLIYSPKVLFFREDEKSFYKFSDKAFECSCIACPALKYPPRDKNDFSKLKNASDYELMERKVRTIMYTALKHGHDSLVLSAHGCGAWGCPPDAISKIYKKVLDEFAGYFRVVVFAIIDNFAVTGNYQIFKKNLENIS